MNRVLTIAVAFVFTPVIGLPQPANPVDQLRRYLGTWAYEGDVNGARVTCQSQRRLITIGYFVESHRECVTAQGPITQVEVFGYSSQRQRY